MTTRTTTHVVVVPVFVATLVVALCATVDAFFTIRVVFAPQLFVLEYLKRPVDLKKPSNNKIYK